MSMANTNQIDNDLILNEILSVPSEKIITGRFSASNESESSDCSGKCTSGICRTLV